MTALALHERLQHDVDLGQVMDGDRRYVLLRADVLMGIFEGLPEHAAQEALTAFRDSVNRHGSASVRAYERGSDPDPAQLLATVASGAASLGWGRWHVELDGTTCRLRVLNSPFAQARDGHGKACAAIVGMLSAVCSRIWREPVLAREVRCAACAVHAGGPEAGICTFEATFQPST
jgi:predicted hydrocarbon binding protein